MLSPLTNDLDFLSEKLFGLKTKGGEEYSGEVIYKATNTLYWSEHKDDLRIILIVGNEGFDQGGIDYRKAIKRAKRKNIIVNTIFCGSNRMGHNLKWSDGAKRGGGKYMNIDSDAKVVHIPTPHDDTIIILNQQLNQTYIGYGREGIKNKKRQAIEDEKTQKLSVGSYVNRAVSKSSKQYKTESWDAISAYESGNKDIAKEIKSSNIEFADKSDAQITKMVEAKSKERKKIKLEIQELEKKRRAYIQNNPSKSKSTFGEKIIKEIKNQMRSNGYSFK